MRIHLISGFLGSGKTTAIQTACKALLSENCKTAVITNDQGIRLVDTAYFESNSIPNRQVINGCFCCNYNSLDENIQSLIQTNNPDIIFAESVGSCTDIVATVMKPLLQFKKNIAVTVSTFADARLLHMLFVENKQLFNNEVKYIYQKQLEEAEIMVVSKIDLITKEELNKLKHLLYHKYPSKNILYINATDEKSITKWLNEISNPIQHIKPSSLNIDYEIYGAGEAMLAWLDAELKICSNTNNAIEEAITLVQAIYNNVQNAGLTIGHLKFLINNTIKISYTAALEKPITIKAEKASTASLLINARIQTMPELLNELVKNAKQKTEINSNCTVIEKNISFFKPGFPEPTFRIAG